MKLKLGYLVKRHPVGCALTLALFVLAIPLYAVLEQQKDIRITQKDIRTTQSATRATQGRLVASTRRNCRRANVQNAYVRLRVERDPLPPKIFPILNCVAALEGSQRGVPLPADEQRKYIEAIARDELPIVVGAHVVDTEPFPAGGPSGAQIDRTEG